MDIEKALQVIKQMQDLAVSKGMFANTAAVDYVSKAIEVVAAHLVAVLHRNEKTEP